MKKWILIGIAALALVAVAGLAWFGTAYAQSQTPPFPGQPWGRMGGSGMMGGYAGYGMMGAGDYGPMHPYMVAALADALHLDQTEVQTRMNNGETPWQIAQAQGLTSEQAQQIILDAHDKALDQAVKAGLLTQAQADWMDQHMESMWSGNGAGFGCPGANGTNGTNGANSPNNNGSGFRRGGPMMNWNNTVTE